MYFLKKEEEKFFSQLTEKQKEFWNQLTQVQKKMIFDAYYDEKLYQMLGFTSRQVKGTIFQVFTKLMSYCIEKGFPLNERRWRLIPRFRRRKSMIRTSASILSELKMVMFGEPEKRRAPESIDVVDDKTGNIIVRLKRKGTVKEYNRGNAKWEVCREEEYHRSLTLPLKYQVK